MKGKAKYVGSTTKRMLSWTICLEIRMFFECVLRIRILFVHIVNHNLWCRLIGRPGCHWHIVTSPANKLNIEISWLILIDNSDMPLIAFFCLLAGLLRLRYGLFNGPPNQLSVCNPCIEHHQLWITTDDSYWPNCINCHQGSSDWVHSSQQFTSL